MSTYRVLQTIQAIRAEWRTSLPYSVCEGLGHRSRFTVVSVAGGLGSLRLSANRIAITLQAPLRAEKLPSHFTMHQ